MKDTMYKRLLFLSLLFLTSILPSAFAEGTVTIILSEETQTDGNTAYKKDDRKYDRDLLIPVFDGVQALLYDQTNAACSYLFACAEGGETELYLAGSEAYTTICIGEELLTADSPVTVALGEEVAVRIATANARCVFYLSFTSLPIVSIAYEPGTVSGSAYTGGTISLLDPSYRTDGLDSILFTSEINIKYRGDTSLKYAEKKNYTVNLLSGGEKEDTSLLGMRCDSDWTLDGMYNDLLRMRNRLGMALWDSIAELPWDAGASGAVDGVFIELVVNGVYKGIYCFSEKLDRKQVGADKTTGIVYRSTEKSADGVNAAGFKSVGSLLPTGMSWYNFKLKYPQEDLAADDDWDILYAFCDFVVHSDDEAFAARIGEYAYVDNLADYYILINAISANDNMDKNMYWAVQDSTADTRLFLLPWDMDAAFGRAYRAYKVSGNSLYSNVLFDRLAETDAGGFNEIVAEKWRELRNTVFSEENIASLIDAYAAVFEESGAWEREIAAHPTFYDSILDCTYCLNLAKEVTYVKSFMKSQAEYLDSIWK